MIEVNSPMNVTRPTGRDWLLFSKWAADEGWRVPAYEIKLFNGLLASAAAILKDGERCLGFVTAVAYEKTGWIGNLIVPRQLRGNGLGRTLFEYALDRLVAAGIRSAWLTASEMGAPLYRKYGFRDVGFVERWSALPAPAATTTAPAAGVSSSIHQFDRRAWGESRELLLKALARHGVSLAAESSAALLQSYEDIQILGPWYENGAKSDRGTIVDRCLRCAADGIPLVVDLVNGHPARDILAARGFRLQGKTRLMAKGCQDQIDLGSLVSLASLGSIG